MERTSRSSSVLQTVGAIPLALLAWALVSTIATFLGFVFYSFLTVLRPGIIGFIANAAGGFFGVIAAKTITAVWLPAHSGKAVAVAFFAFCGLIIFSEWAIFRNPANPVAVTAGAVVTIIFAYQLFWQGAEL